MTDKILIDRSVVEQALGALEKYADENYNGYNADGGYARRVGATLRAALETSHEVASAKAEQPAEQEPVAVTIVGTKAALWDLAVKNGLVTVHSEELAPAVWSARLSLVSWMEGHEKACDISYDAVRLAASEAPPPAKQMLNADDLKEPKNGKNWRVEWWNESCRMMLPAGSMLDSFQAYKNGTLQFTIKKTGHGIGGGV